MRQPVTHLLEIVCMLNYAITPAESATMFNGHALAKNGEQVQLLHVVSPPSLRTKRERRGGGGGGVHAGLGANLGVGTTSPMPDACTSRGSTGNEGQGGCLQRSWILAGQL